MRVSFTAATLIAIAVAGSLVNSAIIPRREMNRSRVDSRYFNDHVEAAEARDVPEIRSGHYDRGYAESTYHARAHPRDFVRRVPVAAHSNDDYEQMEARDDRPVVVAYYVRGHARDFSRRGQ
ncbi:hypothetical protein PC9H_004741 [Pleurotus ostreatus]|uniref:Uncharacterized protein n=3 Tax=Pleurotus TaxID=5320 RepID=A0A067NNU4_PLEO1|nr:uncharacterized protein PC9H_004741 [Pleurotus ostreatus]KAF7432798.1 hypothetical protein PC9H_004741 [Pleurotus ostreatus]KAG9218752.1 hypothetical protein CCMSSC00406_0001134 [Pleurotus cornucopiae]KAJ8698650.1 hypothetical protein PTI98_005336 [Pleurotus ostreatus]KDQ29604.1 hypothetical protein PLEOSDRAFT_1089182 [Pleurotus ostreatus PC15]